MIFELDNDDELEDFLEHFGVKGMHWGVRKDRGGVSRATDRTAQKDAVEFSRAKQFTGIGAGNRRKQINATVESRSKNIPGYKARFDHHVNAQDMAQHVVKAQKERKSIDRRTKNTQRAGALARRFTGEMGTQAAFVGVALAGTAFIASPKGRLVMANGLAKAQDFAATHKNSEAQQKINQFLRANGR